MQSKLMIHRMGPVSSIERINICWCVALLEDQPSDVQNLTTGKIEVRDPTGMFIQNTRESQMT